MKGWEVILAELEDMDEDEREEALVKIVEWAADNGVAMPNEGF